MSVNWYDAARQHYIGPHHDEIKDLVRRAPIVTVSLGERRIYRLTREAKRDGKRKVVAKHDLAVDPGSVIVIPLVHEPGMEALRSALRGPSRAADFDHLASVSVAR